MRLIQVGLGGFGRSWAPLIQEAPGVELVAVVDADAAARERAAAELGLAEAAIFPALADAVMGVEADAVLVATPPETHRAVAEAALATGKHVLVEKPLATSMDDARALVAAAEAAGRTLMVSQNYRFRPPPRAVARLVAAGTIGEVISATIRFRRDTRGLWPADNFRYAMRHPVVIDMSIHHFDLLRALTGREVRRVYARGWRVPDSPYAHDPAVAALLTLDNGASVLYEGNWAPQERDTSWNGDWEIAGEQGRVRWSGGEADATTGEVALETWGEPARAVETPPVAAVDRAGTLAACWDAGAGGAEPETSGRDNLGSLAVVLACVESLERGEVVALDGGEFGRD